MGNYEGSTPWEFAGGRTVLVAEDNDINAEIVKIQLEDFGFKVERAHNGQEAVDMLSGAEIGHYCIIVMDVMMPVLDGHEATKAIRAMDRSDSDIPIIAVTANAFDADVHASKECGMNHCITKPYNKSELYGAITELLGE